MNVGILSPVVRNDPDRVRKAAPRPRLLEKIELAPHVAEQPLVGSRARGGEGVEVGAEARLPLRDQHRLNGRREDRRLGARLAERAPDIRGADPSRAEQAAPRRAGRHALSSGDAPRVHPRGQLGLGEDDDALPEPVVRDLLPAHHRLDRGDLKPG